jgi:beta-glucosidase
MRAERFPKGFLFGAATSHHQVEGGAPDALEPSDWTDWTRARDRIADGSSADVACDWWRGRAEADLSLARSLGHTAHRLSVSWARIEPSPGRFDEAALDRYDAILSHARAIGLTASVTLHHFTLPRWLAARGGFGNEESVERFASFCARVVERLRERVDRWATINEPSVYAMMSWGTAKWPPGARSALGQFTVLARLGRAHDAAYRAIKRAVPEASVGIVLNAPAFDPDRPERARDRAVTFAQDHAFTGRTLGALDRRGTFDWLGLNYYGRYRVRFDPRAAPLLFGRHVQKGIRHGEVDWGEPSPEGLTRNLVRFAALGRPVFVTENGVFDPTDALRQRYLVDHVSAVHAAIARGADVRGYFHWSLLDNFEWAEGWQTPFGLIEVDRTTGERRVRGSARRYQRIIEASGA